MKDIPFVHIPTTIKEFLRGETDMCPPFVGGNPGFEFVKGNENDIYFENIKEMIGNAKINKKNPLFLRFLIDQYAIVGCNFKSHITWEFLKERYIISTEKPTYKENMITFEDSLIFPYGKDNNTLQGRIMIGPEYPTMKYFDKIEQDKRERIINQAIKENKLDPKVYGKYMAL